MVAAFVDLSFVVPRLINQYYLFGQLPAKENHKQDAVNRCNNIVATNKINNK